MAKILLKDFIKKKIVDYGTNRDIPSVEGTSKLSPYLAFGEISSQAVFDECYKISQKKIASYDAIVLSTNHDKFNYPMIQRNAKLIIDTRGVFKNKTFNLVSA